VVGGGWGKHFQKLYSNVKFYLRVYLRRGALIVNRQSRHLTRRDFFAARSKIDSPLRFPFGPPPLLSIVMTQNVASRMRLQNRHGTRPHLPCTRDA